MGHSQCCTTFEPKPSDSILITEEKNQGMSYPRIKNKLNEKMNGLINSNNYTDKLEILEDVFDQNIDENEKIKGENLSLESHLSKLYSNNEKSFNIDVINDPLTIQKGFEMAQISESNLDLINNIKLSQIISKEEFFKIPQDAILYEGDLQKFKPGINISFIPRFGQITKQYFFYFKNVWSANCFLAKPIAFIPLNHIDKVIKYKKEINNNLVNNIDENAKKCALVKAYIFEIILKNNQCLKNISSINSFQNNACKSKVSKSIKNKYQKYEESKLNVQKIYLNKYNNMPKCQNRMSMNEMKKINLSIESDQSTQREFFSPNENQYITNNKDEYKRMNKNIEFNYKTISPIPTPIHNFENKKIVKAKKNAKDISNNYINIIENPSELIERRKKNICQLSPEKQIKITNVKKYELNNLSLYQNSWDNRMIEWFQADERLIFLAKNELDCDRWICLLRFLTQFQSHLANKS